MNDNLDSFIKAKAQEYTILIIDDNPNNLGFISDCLQGYGFTVLVDRDGESGLETAFYGHPDLILLDVKMPGVNGFETCRRLKANKALRDIPVIFLTALAGTGDKIEGFRLGAVDYVTKPLQPEELLARVVTHLRQQALTQELQQANKALHQAQTELELRVAQRTAALVAANSRLQIEINERMQAEEKIRQLNQSLARQVTARTRELAAVYQVAAVASQSLDMKTTLEKLLQRVLAVLDSPTGAIHLLDKQTGILALAVQQGFTATQAQFIFQDSDLVGQVIEQAKPLLLGAGLAGVISDALAFDLELNAYTGLPVQAGGETIGVLSIFRRAGWAGLSEEEVALLTTIADLVGVVVESARLRALAEQAERDRLARELHDSVTQSLYSLTLMAEWGNDLLDTGQGEAVRQRLVEIGATAQQALKEMRLLVYQLRPVVLEQEGLVNALQQRLDTVERRAGVKVNLKADPQLKLPKQAEEGLYWIALEALNNALKHAAASLITVQFTSVKDQVTLTITDNGRGFEPDGVRSRGGLGLVSMQERAGQIGGTFTIVSAPGQGTTVEVSLEVSL